MKSFSIFQILIFSAIGSFGILLSCKEDEKNPFPKVLTLEAIPTSGTSCIFKGNIVSTGSSPILDYGFV